MQKIKSIYFIGGTSDFSKQIVDSLENDYGYDVKAVGRRTGHSVSDFNSEGLKKIKEEFTQFDAVINFTFAGGKQYDLTVALYGEMMERSWQGYFLNFGSTIVLHHSTSMRDVLKRSQIFHYQGLKKAVQYIGHQISTSFMSNPFRYTAIQCGMLDNAKMQALPRYRPTCIKPHDLSRLLDFCLQSPPNWHLHEIMLDAR